MMIAIKENKADPQNHAMQDFQDLAQAEKNCYDISGLILPATLRYIASERRRYKRRVSSRVPLMSRKYAQKDLINIAVMRPKRYE